MNLSTAATDWLDFLRFVRRLSPSSMRTYAGHLRRFGAWAGAADLEAAAAKVEPYLVALGRRGMADNTFAITFTVLRGFYRWSSERGLCTSSPLRWSKMPKVRKVRRSWLNSGQVDQLLRAGAMRGGMHIERDTALLALIFYAALRNGEATGARLEDLDMEGKLLRVYGKGGQIFMVPLGARILEILRAWLAVRPEGTPWLFPSRAHHAVRGGQLDTVRVGKIVREVRALAGLERVTAHTLRRSAATILRREKKAPLEVVQDMLRHSLMSTTMVYIEERGLDGLRPWAEKL